MQTIALRAELKVGDQILSDDLWQNQLVNSWMSIIPIKYEFHTESIGRYYNRYEGSMYMYLVKTLLSLQNMFGEKAYKCLVMWII